MDNDRKGRTLKIALASYDRKELRVQKRYLEEEDPSIRCECFQSGSRMLQALQAGRIFDIIILCSEMEDMTGLEFLMHARRLEPPPMVLMFDEGRRHNESALCMDTEDGVFYLGQSDLRSLLRQLYRMPGQQGQKREHQCQELYRSWGIQQPDANCSYLTSAVDVVFGSSQKMAIRKEILQAVGQKFGISVSAVDSGIRRMIDQLEASPTEAWTAFKEENGFAGEKLTTGKLIYAVKSYLRRQSDQ